MADVTGPIRTLPGSRHPVPAGATCDEHPHQPAVGRIQGETDSFGAELLDLCQECLDAIAPAAGMSGCCDWCHQDAQDLRHHRDFEEGSCGPVYRVCGACRRKESEYLAAEAAEWDEQRALWGD
jgi:hypothetical protein